MIAEMLESLHETAPLPEPPRENPHVHDYKLVPVRERDDNMKYVCSMFKCECGEWYWL